MKMRKIKRMRLKKKGEEENSKIKDDKNRVMRMGRQQ
jgi:hypothetical protein